MDIKDTILIVVTIFSVTGGIAGAWATVRGIRPKSLLDDSSAAGNYQKLVIELQDEIAEYRPLIAKVAALEEHQAHTDGLLIEYMRGAKILIAQLQRQRLTPDWFPPISDTTPPKRNTGGLGLR